MGYDPPIESDILLLDISNNNEYIWSTNFDSSFNSQSSNLSPSPSATQSKQSSSPINSVNSFSENPSEKSPITLFGTIVGSLFGGSLLLFGALFLYKWNQLKENKKNAMI